MFDRIKKAFTREGKSGFAASSQLAGSQISEWAGAHGMSLNEAGTGKGFSMSGRVVGKPWRMELGQPSRNFIRGEELRARAELGINDDVAVLVMNRPLKESLEKAAYSLYTDSLQTTADPNLPEEMRWLSMYEEVGWEGPPRPFWDRYAVLADQRENAMAFVDTALAGLMLAWPEPAPSREVPFMLMLLRGKAYLRMEYTPADMPTLEHAAKVFTRACEAAVGGLSTDIAL